MMTRVLVLFVCAAALIASGPDSKLLDAAKQKDTAALRALLHQNVDVNAQAPDGATALHWAAYRDDLETVALLVHAGANVKAANRYGVTPLSLACTNGNACGCSSPCFPNVPRSLPSFSWIPGMLVLRAQTSSGSTSPFPAKTMLAMKVQ